MWASLFKVGREAIVLGERLIVVQSLAQRSMDLATENRERIIRLETVIDMAVRAGEKRLPPG